MPRRTDLQKVMVIGSGPIVIGQAAEFDYAGTQACQALKEEGYQVVLLNSNPATIMTDVEIADRVYLEPLTVAAAEAVIARERPQGLVPTLGGQVGLNLAVRLAEAGILEKYGVELLGTPLAAIRKAEDREAFKHTMQEIGQPVPESEIITEVEAAVHFARKIGFPVIVRPAYTLGGAGGGLAENEEQLRAVVERGLRQSPIGQVLVERSLIGWKEVEYEVMRDGSGACITVCNMENLDPVGVHTGDSIVVAPTQTLTDQEHQMLRMASFRIIRALGIAGGCNVQLALDPKSRNYFVIEVNPRVSRSSALASKATGYPIAKVAAKIAVGLRLDEITNPVTGTTTAFFEPTLDYLVVKVPRWPFDKFASAHRTLGTQMKATGEVMAIDRTFEGALHKAIRSLDVGPDGLFWPEAAKWDFETLERNLRLADDRRLFLMGEALRRGWEVDRLAALTGIDRFFLGKLRKVILAEAAVAADYNDETLRRAKALGVSDRRVAQLTGLSEADIRLRRQRRGLLPVYKMVDTCAGEFEAFTPYFYGTYEQEDEAPPSDRPKVVVLGSGPIRIGQGIEFDYSSVHAVWALRRAGYEAIIINNNPETVSTDFNTADRLYFEPLTLEDVLNVIEKERPIGVICQFGGQTAINLASALDAHGVRVLGTSVEAMDQAEDRKRFDALVEGLGLPRPAGGTARDLQEALAIAERIGYPALVRPSYVLGGRAMEIVHGEDELRAYINTAVAVSGDHPVLIDRYLQGMEAEVDAISDGETVVIPGIMEHVERAGVHSGDSIAVVPPYRLSDAIKERIVAYTIKLARALRVVGLLNVQYVIQNDEVYVIEVNPRSSRTVPFLTKVTGVPMVQLAVQAIMGGKLVGWQTGLVPARPYSAVKMPVFSWAKLIGVDTALGPEMKSTGEAMGIASHVGEALQKAFQGAGISLPEDGRSVRVLITIADRDKAEALPIARALGELGFECLATPGTARFLEQHGLRHTRTVSKIGQGSPDVLEVIRQGQVDLVINTLTRGRTPERDGFRIRRASAELGVPVLTSLDTAAALVQALQAGRAAPGQRVQPLQDYLAVRA